MTQTIEIKDKGRDAKVVMGEVRFSYVHIIEPDGMEGEEKKFQVTLLIPKTETEAIAEVQRRIAAVAEEAKAAKFGGKIPKGFKNPLRDGDEKEDNPEYEGMMFITLRSKNRPGVVDSKRNNMENLEDLYSGCYGWAGFTLYAYNNKSMGVAALLDNLMKTDDGEKFAGGTTAADDFGAPEGEDDFEL